MPRTIEIQYKDSLSIFSLTKLDRSTLYGSKRRFLVDPDGQACTTASFTTDGQHILPAGGKDLLYLDKNSDTVERCGLVAVDLDGKKIEREQSTLS